MLDILGVVVPIPVADRLSIVVHDAPNGDGRRDHIFGKIVCQAFPAGWDLALLDMGDESFRVLLPAIVDVPVDSRVCYMFAKHGEQVILPFTVYQIVREVVHLVPVFSWIDTARSCEDMEVRVVVACPSRGLEDDDGTDVQFFFGIGTKDIGDAFMPCPGKMGKKCRVTVKPQMQPFRYGENDVAIGYTRQEPSADEFNPLVGVDLAAGEAERGLAAESDEASFSAIHTAVLGKAQLFWIPAVEHLLDYFVVAVGVIFRIDCFEVFPVIPENLLESLFVDVFHSDLQMATVIVWKAKQK